jgi:hypothetical protein
VSEPEQPTGVSPGSPQKEKDSKRNHIETATPSPVRGGIKVPPLELPERPVSPVNMPPGQLSAPVANGKRLTGSDHEGKSKKFIDKMMKQFTSVEELLDRKDCKALLDWASSLSKHAKSLAAEGKGMEQVADKLFHLAEQNYEQAMKLEPKNKRVFIDWGKTLLRLGSFLEKRRNLLEAYRQYKQASALFQFGLELEVNAHDVSTSSFFPFSLLLSSFAHQTPTD